MICAECGDTLPACEHCAKAQSPKIKNWFCDIDCVNESRKKRNLTPLTLKDLNVTEPKSEDASVADFQFRIPT